MKRLRQGPDRGWRWLALLMVVVSCSLSCLYFWPRTPELSVNAEGVYESLYTPADYALIIWGVIGVSLFVYAIIQLLPSQSDERIFDQLAKPLVLSNMFFIGRTAAFFTGAMWISTALMCCMLATSLGIYARVRDSVLRGDNSNWLSVPFSLLAGWLCVVTIDSGVLLLVSLNMPGSISSQVIWTTVMILVSPVLAIWTCFRCRDFVFPLVISWALIAVFVARREDFPYLGAAALVGAAMPAIWIVTALIQQVAHRHRTWANKLSF